MNKLFILLPIVLLLLACSNEETIVFGFSAPEAEKIAINTIKEQDIWFKKMSDGRYEFRVSDVQQVKEIYRDASNLIIPEGRSSGYGPEMLKIMKKLLNETNIPYQVRQYQGADWVVWAEENHEKVEEIEAKAKEELMVKLNEQIKK